MSTLLSVICSACKVYSILTTQPSGFSLGQQLTEMEQKNEFKEKNGKIFS